MKALNHPQAQRWIHARLAGELRPAVADRLSAHLQNCEACRLYAAQIQNLDAGLRQEFRARRLSAPAVPAHAFDAIPYQVVKSRAKMNTHRLVTNSLSFALLMILLVGGLGLLHSNRSLLNVLAPPAPVLQSPGGTLPTPRPTPTALSTLIPTPLPAWTVDSPLTSSPAMVAFLEELAVKNRDLLRATGWLHLTRGDAGQAGTIPTSFIETWTRSPVQAGAYPESLAIVKDQPEGERIIQFHVCLSDGLCGDLVALRSGEGSPGQLDAPPDPTTAGYLAKLLRGKGELSKNGKMDKAQAWFEDLDGKPAFVLSLHYSPLQPSSTTFETTEVFSFDLETGLALRESVRMVYPDGSRFGETLTKNQYEFLPELPDDVAQEFAAAVAELRSYAAPAGVMPAPTATQLPESALTALDDLPYTRDDPLTEGQTILDLLLALRQRLSGGIGRPGWYAFAPLLPQGRDWTSSRSTVLRVNDDRTCQSMVYYLKDGRILPNEITLEDGAWGLIGDVQAGIFTEAEADHAPCSPEQVDNLVWLDNEIDFFREFLVGKIDGEYRLWVDEIAGRRVLVLFYDIRYQPPKPVTMNPDTRALEPEDRSVKWLYFDLETGSILGHLGQFEQVTLENGKTLGEPYQEGDPLTLGIHFYENPPAELLQAFEQALQDLRLHLESMTQ
jgi:hypothetical protein